MVYSIANAQPTPETRPTAEPAAESATPAIELPAENSPPEQAEPSVKALRYQVEVEGPQPLRGAVSRNLDISRWQDYPDMTLELLERLMREARDQAREIAATEGYLSPKIETDLDRTREPALLRLTIEPGEPVRIEHVELGLTGAVAADSNEREARLEPVRRNWSLPPGNRFRQEDWVTAKLGALNAITAIDYAAAQISASEAAIDPDAHAAQLAVTIDSGPRFRFGDLNITGLQKYQPDIVRNLTDIQPGEPYAQERLNRVQRRMTVSGYFASVQARINPDPAKADAAPVDISVIEAATRRLEAGVGYSTDTHYRLLLKYSDVNIDDHALQMLTELRLEGLLQNASVNFNLPPRSARTIDSFGGKIERTFFSGLTTRSRVLTARRHEIDERDANAYSLSFHHTKQTAPELESDVAHAVYAEYERALRSVDELTAPNKGYVLSARAGVGIPGVSSRGFGRAVVQGAYYLPVGRGDALQLRAEMGAIFAGSRSGIPADLLFRTGGDNTVRGYAYESLGVQRGDVTLGGRYYTAASAEYIHWLTAVYGIAAFVDAGNAGESFKDLSPAVGYGIGARLRTPIGPFRVDVAYGRQAHAIRLHLSVGVSF